MSVKSGRLLSGEELRLAHQSTDQALPTAGQKDFRPTGSWLEKKQIQTALDEKKQLLEAERVEKLGFLAQAEWYEKKKLAEITVRAGKFAQTMGFEKDGKIFLYPEEALYLLETNCLQLMYHGVAMSIQQGYSLLLSPSDCPLKQYRTYCHLSKQGYRLLRYSKTGQPTAYELQMRLDQHVPKKRVFPDVNVDEDEQTECTEVEDRESAECTEAEDQQTEETTERDQQIRGSPEERQQTRGSPQEDQRTAAATTSSPRNKKEGRGSRKEVPPDKIKESVKKEKDSVSGPMKDFAQSVADMGKCLFKTENCNGRGGLGLDSLRQNILDMLENHFQGQISQEAMDAVSMSASKAILDHVEDVDCDKRQTNAEPSEGNENGLSVDLRGNAGSSSEMTCDDSGDKRTENRAQEELGNSSGRPSDECGQVESEEVPEKRGKVQSLKVSKMGDEAESEVVSKKSGEAGLEEIPKESEEAESKEVSMRSDEAALEMVRDRNNETECEEVSKESAEAVSEEVSKKSAEAVSEGVSKKSAEAVSEGVSKKSAEAVSEGVSKKSVEAVSEEVCKESAEGVSKESAEAKSEGGSEKDALETVEPGKESEELPKECEIKLPEKSGNVELAEKSSDLETDDVSKESGDSRTRKDSERDDVSNKIVAIEEPRGKGERVEGEINKSDLETIRVEKTVRSSAVCARQPEAKRSSTRSEMRSESRPLPGDEDKTDKNSQDVSSEKGEAGANKENKESGGEEDEELLEVPIKDCSSQACTRQTEESSRCDKDVLDDPNESGSEIFEWEVLDGGEPLQGDDDVVEIDDPNSWKNAKVEPPEKDSKKRPFTDSNGWKSFKESQSENPSKKAKLADDDDGDVIAVRDANEIEIIDITEEVTPVTNVKCKQEIEVVDLDESESGDSDSDLSEEKPNVKVAQQRSKLVSAFERARDTKRKLIMDSFPNMIEKAVLTVQVPQRHLLPPNINPVQPTYTIQRKAVLFDRPYQSRPQFQQRRYMNSNPRYPNHFHPNQPNHYPRFRPPMNPQRWPGMPFIQNAQAMQAFQVITSIVLPMFGINNVGPPFRGQQPNSWNPNPNMGSPMWQPRPWQNSPPWRNQGRQPWNRNRFNRPWPNRNLDREEESVPERPKRPALLPNPGQVSPTPGSWNNDNSNRMVQPVRSESRRPKRPFLFENNYTERSAKSAKELLTDIEDELCWKKIRTMNEESDSDSEDEVTITPIQPKTSSQLEPLLKLDHCTNSATMMESLQVIKKADPRSIKASGQNRILKISYDIFLPNVPLKKSVLSRPNFRLCIMGVDEQFPSPGEIALLLNEIHDNVPLLFAIVDPDSISFFNYSAVDLPKLTFST